MRYKKYCGLFLFTCEGHEDSLFRTGLREFELNLLDKIKDVDGLVNFEDTGDVMDIGPRKNRPVLRIDRMPYEMRIQDLTKKQAKKVLIDLSKFCVDCAERGVCVWDISESNILYWNGKSTFVDLDAFGPLDTNPKGRSAFYGYVKFAYMFNKYMLGKNIVGGAADYSHTHVRRDGGWFAKNMNRDHVDVKLWKDLKKMVEDTVAEGKKTHWSEEYAHDEQKLKDNEKLKIVLPFLEPAYGGSMLDIGTNKGYYLEFLKDNFTEMVGFDVDERCIDIAEARYGSDKIGFAKFGIEDVFAGNRQTDSRIERYKSDVVLGLAITHHFKTCRIDTHKAAKAIVDLSKKWILIEDIENTRIYKEVFEGSGFELHSRVKSYPKSRGLSLWRRKTSC